MGGDGRAPVLRLAAAHAQPLRLGTVTRPSLRVPPDHDLELTPPAGARAILVSFGLRNPDAIADGVRFSISAPAPGVGRRTLFTELLGPGDAGWRERRLTLPPGDPSDPGARTLRFETRMASLPDAPEEGGEPPRRALPLPAWGRPLVEVPAAPSAPAAPAGIVLISLDTLGATYLGAFEGPSDASPRLDAFLDEGFSFRRAYAQYGNTLVSHASLFSGLHPVNHGVYPTHAFGAIGSLVPSLAELGFAAVAFTEGAFVSSAFGFADGFDAYDNGARGVFTAELADASSTFDAAAHWLETNGRHERFFLFLHTYEVHSPYLPRDDEARAVAERLAPPLPPGHRARLGTATAQTMRILNHNAGRRSLDPTELDYLRALHTGEIHTLDGLFGDFLARLALLGLAEDTLVIVTADHGDAFGEDGKAGHGETLHNRVLHVPLAFRWPGHVPSGASDAPVQLVDVLPTIFELIGAPPPPAVDGRSLVPVMRDAGAATRPAFSEMRTASGECRQLGREKNCPLDRFAVQTERFKLVSSALPEYARLYDLRADPLETRDVAAEHPAELARHRRLLQEYLASAHPPEDRPETPTSLDDETRRRLQALGYLDE